MPLPPELLKSFQESRSAFILGYLCAAGLAKNECRATWERVPTLIKSALPKTWEGFGLVGSFGGGKSFAIASALSKLAEKQIDNRMAAMVEAGSRYPVEEAIESKSLIESPWPLWCNWPGESAARRAQLFGGHGSEVEGWILKLQDPGRLLILDDIGAEKPTSQDWAGDVFARIIDERLRQEAITVWTSNLDALGLVGRYGPRTFSRLHALAPAIVLPPLPDLRLCPKAPVKGP